MSTDATTLLDVPPAFREVQAIPRSPAQRITPEWGDSFFFGGLPRCPKCLRTDRIEHNGSSLLHKHGAKFGFHCDRCRVWWKDIDRALCFVCGSEFATPANEELIWIGSRENEGHGSCYHINTIDSPFCPRCAAVLGKARPTARRQRLRKLLAGQGRGGANLQGLDRPNRRDCQTRVLPKLGGGYPPRSGGRS